jgi:hypothetical protein
VRALGLHRRAAAALVLLAAAAAAPAAAEVEVAARLSPTELPAGQLTRLVVEVRGGVFDRLRPSAAFETHNLEVVAGPDRVENVQWINGVTSRSVSLVWLLRAGEPGRAAVHSLVVDADGERHDLPVLEARVADGPGEDANGRDLRQRRSRQPWRLPDPLAELLHRRWPPAPPEPPEIHLVAAVSPERVWNGEQVLYTLYLYTQTSIANVSANELPDFRGFWVEEVPQRAEQRAERVEWRGEVFYRTPLLERVLFPLRPGRHVVEAAEVQVQPRPDADPWAPRPRLDPAAPRTLAGRRVVVDVLPLPPPPADLAGSFDGLVGEFSLAARLLPAQVSAGEAATLEVTLGGRGNLESLAAPPLPPLPGLEVLPAHEEGGNRLAGTLVEAERVWRFPLVPERAGEWEVPPIAVTYFDPERGEYRTTASRPMTLAVRPAVADAGGGERHPIRNAALPADAGLSLWARLAPWLFALPWLLALAVALAGRGRGAAAPRAPERTLCRRFDERLAAAAGEEHPRQAAREIEAAWRDLLAAALGVPPELPPAGWVAELPAAVRAEGRGEELARVVDDLHYLRFAPQLSAVGELTGELIERSRRLARRLAVCDPRRASAGSPQPASAGSPQPAPAASPHPAPAARHAGSRA